ncbi:helix-turn-helix domain-containing protein [Streptomyces sp. NPDC060275]|uniref:helix-turn-helix domain-containing protein n=1 Tax=Streptomyces sp. NPDC060275 TaxID=3347090 RepID=UPI0036582E0D
MRTWVRRRRPPTTTSRYACCTPSSRRSRKRSAPRSAAADSNAPGPTSATPRLRHRTIGETAARWGFRHPAAFSRTFREAYGISPTEARTALHDKQPAKLHRAGEKPKR